MALQASEGLAGLLSRTPHLKSRRCPGAEARRQPDVRKPFRTVLPFGCILERVPDYRSACFAENAWKNAAYANLPRSRAPRPCLVFFPAASALTAYSACSQIMNPGMGSGEGLELPSGCRATGRRWSKMMGLRGS